MIVLSIFDTSLPIANPVLKFLLILVIILVAPLLSNRLKIPHLLSLIIAGAIIGPNGFRLIVRDSSIILSGTAGLLYIMFLAGLEIDLVQFRSNSKKSLVFGLYTFLIPMILGVFSSLYVLNFSILTSVLLASMFASHTLIAYPIVSKLGLAKNRAVNITIGGTVITDTLALLVLAVIVGLTTGEVNAQFWIKLSVSLIVFGLVVMFLFPLIGRLFFKRIDDHVSQYIFVLAMVFLGAYLAQLAGTEAIIGAFLAGLSLNRLIPRTSPLMNRVEFVGNAIFIPFFLIGVGMLIDYRAFFSDPNTIVVAAVMTGVATLAKFLAAWLTQKTFRFSSDERRLIFGLSNAQAAATLAAVLIGYNIILGMNEAGEPLRLLGEDILNGTIIMVLVTCTIASFEAQKGAKNLALSEVSEGDQEESGTDERILIPLNNINNTDELVNLSITVKSKKSTHGLYALTIIDNDSSDVNADKQAKEMLHKAAIIASASDHQLYELLRYDLNIVNGICSVVKEQRITDLVMGLHQKKGISDSFLGSLTEGILTKCNVTTLIYKSFQPLATIKRHLIVVPDKAEKEIGFPFWLIKVWNIGRNTGAKLIFYATPSTLNYIEEINTRHPIACEFVEFTEWDDFLILSRDLQKDDNLIIVLGREGQFTYHSKMNKVPGYLNKYFQSNSFILIYPAQLDSTFDSAINLNNPSILEPIERIDEIGKTIVNLFRRK